MKLSSYTGVSESGPILNVNEDTWKVDLINQIYMVVDGFGGSGIGDVVAKETIENVSKFYTKIGGDEDSTFPFSFSHKYLIEGNALINALQYTNKQICEKNISKAMNDRGGASGIFVAQSDRVLNIVSVGNCQAHLYRMGRLIPLVLPDSLELLGRDLSKREFYTSPLSGLGLFEDLHLQCKEIGVQKDDQIVILTDGAYSRLRDKELKHLLDQKSTNREKIKEVFTLVNERGNLDNQTILILQF